LKRSAPLPAETDVETLATVASAPRPRSRTYGLAMGAGAAVVLVSGVLAAVWLHPTSSTRDQSVGPIAVELEAGPRDPVDLDRASDSTRLPPSVTSPDSGPSSAPPLMDSGVHEGGARSRPRKSRSAGAPERARAPTGSVAIATPGGWAEVYVGSRRLGYTPVEARLPIGRQVVTFHPFGRGPAQRRTVTVSEDKVARVVLRLEAEE
jgi:hypothetical protein